MKDEEILQLMEDITEMEVELNKYKKAVIILFLIVLFLLIYIIGE